MKGILRKAEYTSTDIELGTSMDQVVSRELLTSLQHKLLPDHPAQHTKLQPPLQSIFNSNLVKTMGVQ